MTKGVKDALAMYSKDPWQLNHRRWHVVELMNASSGESVHVHVAVVIVHEKLKAITKPI
ncbi:MAG: hypothetical protein RBG13Loki_2814 [Promethearchaeota archaeon CR_4]|nr:MAG: hypothetical protein RBG13Loki_2814 [Candidatus Lokiarchaeota archaeon CR_4]